MAAPNYAAYDSAQTLSLSAAAHLWVEMTPVAKRGNIAHPSPTDDGWEYEFWLWLKERINQLKSPVHYPKGFHKFGRALYLEIAESQEYAVLVEAIPQLKSRPLLLFPDERSADTGEPVAMGKQAPPAALENLVRLIRDDLVLTHLTLGVARRWLENGVGESEQILGFDDELYDAGIEKLSYARKTETLYYTLPGDRPRDLKLVTFERYILKIGKEGEALVN